MKKRFLQYLFLTCSVAVLFSACRKDQYSGKETLQTGKTFVWITEGNGSAALQFFDVFTDVKPVVLFTVRRDAANTGDLQKAVTVTLTADADSTKKAKLTPFTSDLYTFPSAADVASGGVFATAGGITASPDGNTLTVNFAAGEFAKNIIYKIDGSKLDLTKTYGAVWKISSFGGFTGKVGYSVVAAGVAVKNQYDGTYSYNGNLVRLPADGSTDTSPLGGTILPDGKDITLVTSGPNSNSIPFIFWADATNTQVGGIAGLSLAIDPVTNKVTVTASGNPFLANIPGQENSYDPDTQTFTLNFAWTSGGPGTNGRQAHLTLVYEGSR